ncbi:protein kinase [Streptomyces fradiae]|uniref:protein kinase n=1 Tax=Streptomyces fradiae TaxID=1906 RepID=UPI0035BE2C1C
MEDYAGRVLADRYRLPVVPDGADGDADGHGHGHGHADEAGYAGMYGPVETRAFDTYSGQVVMVRQLPLPETVDAEVVDADGAYHRPYGHTPRRGPDRAAADPNVRRAVEAVQAVARIPDHPRLDQVFDVFTEDGSLWIVSELVAGRPLAALVHAEPLTPYRAAEIANDVLTALRTLHAHGWTHRNITTRTVLVCDDGRVVLSGLAVGAAEEALCGYAPVPAPDDDMDAPYGEDAGTPYEDTPYGEGEDGEGDGGPYGHPGPGAVGDAFAYDAYDAEPYGDFADADDEYGKYRAEGEDGEDAAYGAGDAEPHGARRAPLPAPLPPGPPALPSGYEPQYVARAADRFADDHDGDEHDPYDAHEGPGAPAAYGTHDPYAAHGRDGGRRPYGSPARDPYAHVPEDASYGDGPYRDGPSGGADRGEAWDDQDDQDGREGREGHGAGDDGSAGRPPRALLAGTWRDGPVPAGGGSPYGDGYPHGGGSTYDGGSPYGEVAPHGGARAALSADSRRTAPPSGPAPHTGAAGQAGPGGPGAQTGPGRGTGGPAEAEREGAETVYRGPTTPLAAERARQTRIAVVGAVTERWAPEQAGPVYGTWRLAPPIGPATDLWALGALLFRVLEGHAPYPEDNAAELVQMVCSEPPAFAEECGALRPVVESLLRQDPTERPDFEELRGWLRSLVRSAPEPEAGAYVVPMPSDAARLPIVRRRGDLVRRRRFRTRSASRSESRSASRSESRSASRSAYRAAEAPVPAPAAPSRHRREKARERRPGGGDPRALGRALLLLILLGLAGAVAYAVAFMPEAGRTDGSQRPTGTARPTATTQHGPTPPAAGAPDPQTPRPSRPAPSTNAGTPTAPALPEGYVVRDDPEGFRVGVDRTWRRSPINDIGQVRYSEGDYTLIIVPGRDTVRTAGADPLEYQRAKERELQPWRDSTWSTATGLRRVDVGRQAMAEGQFTWQDANGRQVYVRNLALLVGDRYHVVQVIGPESERDRVTEIYEQATKSYQVTR